MDKSVPEPPTAVLVHGILGCRKNWGIDPVPVVKIVDAYELLLLLLKS